MAGRAQPFLGGARGQPFATRRSAMATLAPLLPAVLLRALARRRSIPPLPHAERFQAALLLSDLSGFTSLTEKLQRRGRHGAEEIAAVVNRAFRPVLRAVDRHDGSVVSFGGDAVFALFPGSSPVRRAAAAAAEIAGHFRIHGVLATSAGPTRLRFSQALHYGAVTAMHLGTEGRRNYVVLGRAASTLARIEARAQGGEIILSRAARAQLARDRSAGARRPGKQAGPHVEERWIREYVPPHVRDMVKGFRGEFRRAVMVFFETRGTAIAGLQQFVIALQEVLADYGGILVGPDLSGVGTRWLCAFGAPVTHEDDHERAARAALELLAKCPAGVAVRGGMQSGTVASIWVGGLTRRSYELLGDATNTAARTLVKADWGEVLTTEEVRGRLVGIATAPRGSHAAKGKVKPLVLHALRGTALPAGHLRVSAPMVGREREIGCIVDALDAAHDGRGRAIGILGEAGIGKSRLRYEAAAHARRLGFDVHLGRAIAFEGMPYWTVGMLLRDALGVPEGTAGPRVLARLSEACSELGLSETERNHLGELLGARDPASAVAQLDDRTVRHNNSAALASYFAALARRRPRLLVLEDMHWADGASIEAVERLTKRTHDAPLVVLLLYRPGYAPPPRVTELLLGELDSGVVAELLGAHLGPVSAHVTKLVAERAGGNPFYVEELVRHLLESGLLRPAGDGYQVTRDPGPEDLPDSLESLIGARLDRLSRDGRSVAQHAAVIGRSFLFELLAAMREAALGLDRAERGVDELVAKELVFVMAMEPREYIFKHALTRDVAYAGVLGHHRRRLHRSVADSIEKLLGSEGFQAMLGFHREQAGQKKEARAAYLAAARAAVVRHAHHEAELLYRRHLELARTPSRDGVLAGMELASDVLVPRGRMAEAESLLRRALDRAHRLRDGAIEGQCLVRLSRVLATTGKIDEGDRLRDEALAVAHRLGDPLLEALALGDRAGQERERGMMAEARQTHERVIALHRAAGDREQEGVNLGSLAVVHMQQWRSAEAEALYSQALAILEEIGAERRCATVLCNLAILRGHQGRPSEARQLYRRALGIAEHLGDRGFVGLVTGNLAGVSYVEGNLDEARSHLERAVSIHREVGARRNEGVDLGQLGIVMMQLGRKDEAEKLYRESLAICRELHARAPEAAVLSSLAMLHMARDEPAEAQAAYEQALAIDRELGARLAEAVTLGHLGILHSRQGKLLEARDLFLQAHAGARAMGVPRYEATWLGNLAGNELLVSGDTARAAELASQGVNAGRAIGDLYVSGQCVCVAGRIELAAGRSAAAQIEEARRIAAEAGAPPEGDLALSIADLERCQAAFEAGAPLVAGSLASEMRASHLAWLRAHRPEAIPSDVMARLDANGRLRAET